ncbi:GL26816 [Drosophila persimilis]|uniref:GL26816 n=1 Tax=Drosophila persimilis TaxID=7234 RepID=B4H2C7_DROPE|nr:GL26816 [Drosophila persimilis]
MPKIFLIKNRLHQQQQRLLESQNLLQHKSQDDERCLVPPLSPHGSGSGSGSGTPHSPSPSPSPAHPHPEPQGQGQTSSPFQQQDDQQPLSLTRKRFHHRRHYFGQSRHSLLADHGLNQNQNQIQNHNQNQNQNSTELDVDHNTAASEVQNALQFSSS